MGRSQDSTIRFSMEGEISSSAATEPISQSPGSRRANPLFGGTRNMETSLIPIELDCSSHMISSQNFEATGAILILQVQCGFGHNGLVRCCYGLFYLFYFF